MIRLKHLITEDQTDPNHNIEGGTRSVGLEIDVAKKIFKKRCGEYRSVRYTGSQIFRGLAYTNPRPLLFVRPSKSYRMAKNTDNFTNAILDIIPSWRDWPKRSKSIVCSSREGSAQFYGKVFEVFPFDGAIIGICPSRDFWDSFPIVEKRLSKAKEQQIDWFNYSMPDALKKLGYTADYWRYYPEDAENLFKYLDSKVQRNPKIFDDILEAATENGIDSRTKRILLDMRTNFKTSESYFDELFNPEKNGFEKVPISKYHTNSNVDQEVWTESDSLMINTKVISRFIDSL